MTVLGQMLVEDGRMEGREEGCEEGREEGRDILLKELVRKKMQRGKTKPEIAEALELDEDTVEKVMEELSRSDSAEE